MTILLIRFSVANIKILLLLIEGSKWSSTLILLDMLEENKSWKFSQKIERPSYQFSKLLLPMIIVAIGSIMFSKKKTTHLCQNKNNALTS
jgi:hypothetical protein